MAIDNITTSQSLVKICTRCRTTKDLLEFNLSHGKPRGICKACHVEDTVSWQRANREKYRARHKQWREKNKDRIRAYGRKTYENMTIDQRLWKAQKSRLRYYKRKYGLTPESWRVIYDAQGGVCAICQIPNRTGRHDILYVDHCHTTGKVRGLLCSGCNVAIAALGDSAEKLERAVEYLRGKVIGV